MYNTGPHLRDLVGSLDAQSMPSADFEVLLIDDGSTDETLNLARELAAKRTNLIVETIPNSGWPGRPRNVGLDLATGDYVFFSDHDDTFGRRALEVMHQMATANGSDIVYGKIVRKGRITPYWPVWDHDVARADIAETAIMSRTVHKLYRRAFLVEHGIRFREGRVRLEDHEFMALALARADVVSIVASEPCYWWIHRTDGSNNSSNPVDPAVYWGHYTHVLQTWEQAAGPGELLDAARLISATQAFSRFSATAYLARSPQSRQDLFTAVHPLFRDHLPPELDHRLPVYKRLRAQALRADDIERFDEIQTDRSHVTFRMATEQVGRRDDRLHVVVRGTCCRRRQSRTLPLEEKDGQYFLPLESGTEASSEDHLLLDSDLGTLELTIRHRETGVEWPVRTQTSHRGPGLTITADAQIDLSNDAFGGALVAGVWDLLARLQFLGEAVINRVGPPEHGLMTNGDAPPPGVYVTANGLLAFKVSGAVAKDRPRAESVAWRGRSLVVALAEGTTGSAVLADQRGAAVPRFAAELDRGSALVDIDAVPGETLIDLWLRCADGRHQRLAYAGPQIEAAAGGSPALAVYATAHNSLSVTRTAVATPAKQLKSRLTGLIRRGR